jgi:hypothetical protein
MPEIFRGTLSGNGIRQASIAGEIAPDPMDAGHVLGRFAWSGQNIAEGERFTVALRDGRVYHIEVERVTGASPRVVWFRTSD